MCHDLFMQPNIHESAREYGALDNLKSVYWTQQKAIIRQTSKLNPNIKPKCGSVTRTRNRTHTILNIFYHDKLTTNNFYAYLGALGLHLRICCWSIGIFDAIESGANNKKCDLTLMDDKCEAAFWSATIMRTQADTKIPIRAHPHSDPNQYKIIYQRKLRKKKEAWRKRLFIALYEISVSVEFCFCTINCQWTLVHCFVSILNAFDMAYT